MIDVDMGIDGPAEEPVNETVEPQTTTDAAVSDTVEGGAVLVPTPAAGEEADRVMRVTVPWLGIVRNVYVNPQHTVHDIIELLLDKVELTEEEHADLKIYRKETKKYLTGPEILYEHVPDKSGDIENYEIREPKGYAKRLRQKEKLEIKRAKQEEEKKEEKGLWKREKEITNNLVSSEKVTLQKKHKKKSKDEDATTTAPVKKLYYGCSMKEISERDGVMVRTLHRVW